MLQIIMDQNNQNGMDTLPTTIPQPDIKPANESVFPPITPAVNPIPDSTTPPEPAPTSVLNPTSTTNEEEPSPSKAKILGKIFAIVMLVILLTAGTFTYLIAYEKITLRNNPELQTKVAGFVMSIPFTPKTPRYVLTKAAQVQSQITSESFDLSIAAQVSGNPTELAGIPGLSNFDLQIKGDADFSNPKSPKGQFNVAVSKDLAFDIMLVEPNLYFKVNKIEGAIKALLSTSFGNEINFGFINQWFVYDTSPLETEARKSLDERKDAEDPTQEFSNDALKILTDESVIKTLVMTKEDLNGESVYKVSIQLTPELVDKIPEILAENDTQVGPPNPKPSPPSEMFKNVSITTFIGTSDYYIRKMDTGFDLEPGGAYQNMGATGPLGGTPTKVSVNITSLFSNFNAKFDFVEPTGAQDYTKLLEYFVPTTPTSDLQI